MQPPEDTLHDVNGSIPLARTIYMSTSTLNEILPGEVVHIGLSIGNSKVVHISDDLNRAVVDPDTRIMTIDGHWTWSKVENTFRGYQAERSHLETTLACGGAGALIIGRSGIGKSMLAQLCASRCGRAWTILDCGEYIGGRVGVAEKRIERIFNEAVLLSPSVIILDSLDVIKSPITCSLLASCVDTVLSEGVSVIATGVMLTSVYAPLRRSGRLDHIVDLHAPAPSDRVAILSGLLPGQEATVMAMAMAAHSLVGADLVGLAAALGEYGDWKTALRVVMSRAGAAQTSTSGVSLDCFYGVSACVDALRSSLVVPVKRAGDLEALGLTPPRGVMLVGPSGVGKTAMCVAAAAEAGLTLIYVAGPQLLSRVVGESERSVAAVFARASSCAPCVLLLDQVESIARPRGKGSGSLTNDRLLSTLLSEIDAAAPGVVVLATAQHTEDVDEALRRPGRFDEVISVPLPDEAGRREILRYHASRLPLAEPIAFNDLVKGTDGWSGAMMEGLCREAALCALRENIGSNVVKESHFVKAMSVLTRYK